jgi:hypothetical protein
MVTWETSAGGRVICKTKRIWSHYLLLDRKESLPNLTPSLAKGPGRFNRLTRPRLGGALSNRLLCLAGLASSVSHSRGRLIGFVDSPAPEPILDSLSLSVPEFLGLAAALVFVTWPPE